MSSYHKIWFDIFETDVYVLLKWLTGYGHYINLKL